MFWWPPHLPWELFPYLGNYPLVSSNSLAHFATTCLYKLNPDMRFFFLALLVYPSTTSITLRPLLHNYKGEVLLKKVAVFVICLHAIIRHLFLKHLHVTVTLTYLAAVFHSPGGYQCSAVYPTWEPFPLLIMDNYISRYWFKLTCKWRFPNIWFTWFNELTIDGRLFFFLRFWPHHGSPV